MVDLLCMFQTKFNGKNDVTGGILLYIFIYFIYIYIYYNIFKYYIFLLDLSLNNALLYLLSSLF